MDSKVNQSDNKSVSERVKDSDGFLQALVEMANAENVQLSFGITLNVGGVIISGQLISIRKYLEDFGEVFAESFEISGHEEIGAMLRRAFKEAPTSVDDDSSSPGPSYIHLADARFHSFDGRTIPSQQGVLWRGKLSSIDGFVLGSLSID